MEVSGWEAAGRRRGRAEIRRREGRAPRTEGAAEGPRRDRGAGAGLPAGPRGASGDGGTSLLKRCPWGGKPRRGHLPSRCSTGLGQPANTASRRAWVHAAQLPGQGVGQGFLQPGGRVSSRYQRFGSVPAAPIPSSPLESSNVRPKSLGPTTTNRRHRFGASRSERWSPQGGGEPTWRSSRGPRA